MKSLEQAPLIYELCVQATAPLTYRQVLDHLGYGPSARGHVIRYGLELVRLACEMRGLPVLTAIVVQQSSGRPSDGGLPEDASDWELEKTRVLACRIWPPASEINWQFVWDNRRCLSDKYGMKDYWTN